MKVFLIDVRREANEEEYQMCSDVILDYFNKCGVDVFVLKQNPLDVHPSWNKLKCFDYVNDDFVLCWDMDLLPKKQCPSIVDALDFDKFNLAVDSTIVLKTLPPYIPEYKYECGLIGIPRKFKHVLDEVYNTCKDSDMPSYEQYHLNRYWARNNYADVHELDKSWNCLFHFTDIPNQFILSAKAVQFTGEKLTDTSRKQLIKQYHDLYFGGTK